MFSLEHYGWETDGRSFPYFGMRAQRLRRVRWGAAPALLLLLGGAAWGARELRYVNWEVLHPPLAHEPLVIREDAKGDGRFDAPRSGNRRHQGVDIVGTVGEPVSAVRSGRVVRAQRRRGLGLVVVVQHRTGWRSLYAHLNTLDVTEGQRVRQGQVLGMVGKTGNARHRWIIPHLHFEFAHGETVVNPSTVGLTLLEPTPQKENPHALGGE